MTSTDIYHENVKQALIANHWKIDKDLKIISEDISKLSYLDQIVTNLILAEKERIKIAVETQSCIYLNSINKFKIIIDQHSENKNNNDPKLKSRVFYLALPIDYNKKLQKSELEELLNSSTVNFIIFEPDKKKINRWINTY